jgi:hypothetical protein
MVSLENPKDEVMHRSFFPDLDLMRFSMMSFNLGLGEFAGESNRPPSLDPFPPWLSFL